MLSPSLMKMWYKDRKRALKQMKKDEAKRKKQREYYADYKKEMDLYQQIMTVAYQLPKEWILDEYKYGGAFVQLKVSAKSFDDKYKGIPSYDMDFNFVSTPADIGALMMANELAKYDLEVSNKDRWRFVGFPEATPVEVDEWAEELKIEV